MVSIKDLTLRVLDTLDERERRMLILTNEGYTMEEIATQMKSSETAVKTAISRARKHAREQLERIRLHLP